MSGRNHWKCCKELEQAGRTVLHQAKVIYNTERELEQARAQLERFASSIVAAKNEQGRGFLEESGCPWCPATEYQEGPPHDANCPVTAACAFLAATAADYDEHDDICGVPRRRLQAALAARPAPAECICDPFYTLRGEHSVHCPRATRPWPPDHAENCKNADCPMRGPAPEACCINAQRGEDGHEPECGCYIRRDGPGPHLADCHLAAPAACTNPDGECRKNGAESWHSDRCPGANPRPEEKP
jgi:hypothetical protein